MHYSCIGSNSYISKRIASIIIARSSANFVLLGTTPQRKFHGLSTTGQKNTCNSNRQTSCSLECDQKALLSTNGISDKFREIGNKLNIVYLMKKKVDKTSTRNGGDIVAQVLKSHGVKYIFTLIGGHISPILVESEKLGIKVIDTRQEVTTVFAADAVARLSGTIGVAAVTAGPGVTNTVTAVKNAQLAESPVLLLGGAAATLLKGKGALQDIDQLSLFKSICKYAVTVTTVRDIAPTLKKAIQIAQSGTPGPVFVEFPIDVLYPYSMVSKEIAGSGPGKGLMASLVKMYGSFYLHNLYAGAWDPVDTTPQTPDIAFADTQTVKQCADVIKNAVYPVMVVGSQACLPPVPGEDTRKAVESIGIPVFLGGMARGLLGAENTLQMRQKRGEALKKADVIILAGAVCDFRLSYGRSLNPKAKIITVNRTKELANKNAGMFWKPTVTVTGDVGTFLKDLASVTDYKCPQEWIDELRSKDIEKDKQNVKLAETPTKDHLNPLKIFTELDKTLHENSVLVADGGDFVATSSYILRPRGPLRWLDPGAFGTLGVGAGFALGAKLCRPDSKVWIIYGDGALGYSLIELDTFVRHKLPIIALVGNDAGWTQIAREQVPLFGSSVGCDLAHNSYEEVAQAFGAEGVLLKKGDNIAECLQKAQNSDKKTILINALIGRTSFRDGSISV